MAPRTMPLSEHRKHSYWPPPRWDSGSINTTLKGSSSGEHCRCNVATQLAPSIHPISSSSYTRARGYLDLPKWVFVLIDAPVSEKSSHTAISEFCLDSGSLSLSRPKWWSARWNLTFVPLQSWFDAPLALTSALCTVTATSTSCSSVREIVTEEVWSFVTLVSRKKPSDLFTQWLVWTSYCNNWK